jgi:hypothetical protein
MIYIDDRIVSKEDGIFTAMIGKYLDSIFHDPFVYTNSVYGIAGMKVGDTFYKISNEIEVRDYFGEKEDVAVFKISEDVPENIHSLIEGNAMITDPIHQKIKHIDVVNEHQRLYENGAQTYDVWITRGFVVELEDGLQISFEKEIWFSEDINIERGYSLIDKFFSTDRVSEGWSEPYKMICERKIIRF